jgi:Cu/Ag efflux protein CusF
MGIGPEITARLRCPESDFAMFRPLLILLVPIALSACMTPEPAAAGPSIPPLGIDLGRSGPVIATLGAGQTSRPQPPEQMQMVHEGHNDAHATGTVNAVDIDQHKVTISHRPIPTIGWPAMVMEFAVAPSIDLHSIKPGMPVTFTIEQGKDGMYVVQAIAPAGDGK